MYEEEEEELAGVLFVRRNSSCIYVPIHMLMESWALLHNNCHTFFFPEKMSCLKRMSLTLASLCFVFCFFLLFRTALMMACEASGLNMVEAFLRRGADVSLVDVFGQNALHYAKLSENIGIQTLLSSKISQDVGT